MAEEKTEKQLLHEAKRAAIKKATHKTSTHAHYVVGPQKAYANGVLYQPGDIIKLPLDQEPSITFLPATRGGVLAAEAAADAEDFEAAVDEADAEEADEPEAKPAKVAAKPSKTVAAKPTKKRADRDV